MSTITITGRRARARPPDRLTRAVSSPYLRALRELPTAAPGAPAGLRRCIEQHRQRMATCLLRDCGAHAMTPAYIPTRAEKSRMAEEVRNHHAFAALADRLNRMFPAMKPTTAERNIAVLRSARMAHAIRKLEARLAEAYP